MLTCSHQQMKVSSNQYIQLSRLCRWCNLLFFVATLVTACRNSSSDITVRWDQQKATGVHIPSVLLPEQNADSAVLYLVVRKTGDTTRILGDYRSDNGIVFEPLLPFVRGSSYEISYRNDRIQNFTIPAGEPGAVPALLAIYPKQDTLPVNLLKLYLQFSQPMRESVSDQYIRLIRNGTDTLQDAFLNLQPELWNEDRTVLTIWFDPGRIKRDLQPNQRMGAPLEEGARYRVYISGSWQDAQGIALGKSGSNDFIAGSRDSISPEPAGWVIHFPRQGSTDPLVIRLTEPLDHFLLEESIQVADQKGNKIKGKVATLDNDTRVQFVPAVNWLPGGYQVIIDPKLEDLAGNNLNKPFDRDVTKTKAPDDTRVHKRTFRIE
jgi:hypothetical protein